MNEPMTAEQRRRLNAMCQDIADQVPWMVSGNIRKMDKDEWRWYFCAHVLGNATSPSIEGDRIIIFSRSSRELDKVAASKCIDLIMMFGDSKGVTWKDPKIIEMLKHYEVR